jgi:hypothetical protein
MKELRLVLLSLAALLALVLSGAFLLRAFRGPQPPNVVTVAAPVDHPNVPPAVRAARGTIERTLADSPDYARFFDRLHLVFPADYESILDALATANAQRKTVNPDVIMIDATAQLRRAEGGLASKASDDALSQIFAVQLKEMQALETRDPHLCVAFLYGANGTDFLSFAADHRALISDVAIAGLDAMNSGRMDSVERGPPSDADFQTLDKALVEKGLSRPQIDALLDGKTPDPPIADEAMCKAGQTYLRTLATLPSDIRSRLYGLAVDLMAKS